MITNLKFKSDIFKYSNKFILHKFLCKFSYNFFFIYIKNLSATYYQKDKYRLQKKLVKDIKVFLKKKKKKSNNMVVNVIKITLKMKDKSLFSIEKNIIEQEKMLYYNLENFSSL